MTSGEQDRLVSEVERLRGLLARLEWGGEHGRDRCPACGIQGIPGLLHDPDCWLAAELRNDERPRPSA